MSTILLVRTTIGDAESADRVANGLIEGRLAACASLSPIRSVYRWKGMVETADEIAILFKTTPDRADELRSAIEARHTYDQPVVEMWEADVDPSVAEWVCAETAKVS